MSNHISHRRAMEALARSQVFYPAVVPDLTGGFRVFSALRLLGSGATIESAMEDARALGNIPRLEPFSRFEGHGHTVLRVGQSDVIAYTETSTMAKRIAHALNHYFPNERRI